MYSVYHIIATYFTGCAGIVASHPFDTVRVSHLQLSLVSWSYVGSLVHVFQSGSDADAWLWRFYYISVSKRDRQTRKGIARMSFPSLNLRSHRIPLS